MGLLLAQAPARRHRALMTVTIHSFMHVRRMSGIIHCCSSPCSSPAFANARHHARLHTLDVHTRRRPYHY